MPEGYQPTPLKPGTKITPPTTGSNVKYPCIGGGRSAGRKMVIYLLKEWKGDIQDFMRRYYDQD
jgi:hypothetical protein